MVVLMGLKVCNWDINGQDNDAVRALLPLYPPQHVKTPIISVSRGRNAAPLLHAELTGPQAYHYGVIVESYYCLLECG